MLCGFAVGISNQDKITIPVNRISKISVAWFQVNSVAILLIYSPIKLITLLHKMCKGLAKKHDKSSH